MSTQTTAAGFDVQKETGEERRPLVMQIIIDRSLSKNTAWNRGTLIAQGAHAATAVLAQTWDEQDTREYVSPSNLGAMHKIVLLGPKTGTLADLSAKLKEAAAAAASESTTNDKEGGEQDGSSRIAGAEDEGFPKHHLWIEQPEGIPTAIALAPNRKPAALTKVLNKCSLFRD
ncbi:hypothetical protein OC846_004952 [Tilletia horrida]|uniref:peptidyl-tRNA hydrolase n=1 Tax=Tilletia horrida TaxID=155126 RepID=A0AAN6GPH5_9BASI|nr:hypothetical protein OC846_004952 [Tilletia horrida]